jgi:hypothetical protein
MNSIILKGGAEAFIANLFYPGAKVERQIKMFGSLHSN